MRKEDIRIGQDITLVSKGIQHSYGGSTYISELQVGSTCFLKVTKVGAKYVYGVNFYMEGEQRKDFCYESKHDLGEYLVFSGMRTDFDAKHKRFQRDTDEYEKLRDETRRTLEWELSQQLNAKMDEWTKAHPRPLPVNLAEIQEASLVIAV
jgi:hypothetical protein